MLKIVILLALAKILDRTGKPLPLAGAYTGLSFIIGLITGVEFSALIFSAVIGFVLATIYFMVLNELENSTFFWVIAFVGGIAIGFV